MPVVVSSSGQLLLDLMLKHESIRLPILWSSLNAMLFHAFLRQGRVGCRAEKRTVYQDKLDKNKKKELCLIHINYVGPLLTEFSVGRMALGQS